MAGIVQPAVQGNMIAKINTDVPFSLDYRRSKPAGFPTTVNLNRFLPNAYLPSSNLQG